MGELSQSKKYGSSRSLNEFISELPLPIALIIADEIRSGVEEKIGIPREVTQTVSYRDKVVETTFTLIDVTGTGKVRELVLLTDKPDFDMYVEIDSRAVINHSFTELQDVSEAMEEVDAFDRDGEYVVRFTNLSFLNRFLALIKPRGRITLKQALVLYNLM